MPGPGLWCGEHVITRALPGQADLTGAADPELVHAIITAGALAGGGIMMAGGAIGDGMAGAQLVAGVARQPEAQTAYR